MALLTLLTDFGTTDYYVAAVKGTVLARAPGVRIVDLAHDVVGQDVAAGAFLLGAAAPSFPPGTLHLAVVDPGVGTERRILAVETAAGRFLGPDNGLLSAALDGDFWPGGAVLATGRVRAVAVERPDLWLDGQSDSGTTFHGRDRFAPAASFLLAGGSLEELGPPLDDPVVLKPEPPRLDRTGERCHVRGRVAHIDRYGNLVTDVPAAWLPALHAAPVDAEVRSSTRAHRDLRRVGTFADLAPGEAGWLTGSLGTLELVANGASLADARGLERGAPVSFSWSLPPDPSKDPAVCSSS